VLDGRGPSEIPVLRRLLEPEASLEARARGLAERIHGFARALDPATARDTTYAGGGALPELALPTWVVLLRLPRGADALAERLRGGDPPALVRIRDDAVVLDLRSLEPEDEKPLEEALRAALR